MLYRYTTQTQESWYQASDSKDLSMVTHHRTFGMTFLLALSLCNLISTSEQSRKRKRDQISSSSQPSTKKHGYKGHAVSSSKLAELALLEKKLDAQMKQDMQQARALNHIEDPKKCPFNQCTHKVKSGSGLPYHWISKHTSERPYVCDTCHASFKHFKQLKQGSCQENRKPNRTYTQEQEAGTTPIRAPQLAATPIHKPIPHGSYQEYPAFTLSVVPSYYPLPALPTDTTGRYKIIGLQEALSQS